MSIPQGQAQLLRGLQAIPLVLIALLIFLLLPQGFQQLQSFPLESAFCERGSWGCRDRRRLDGESAEDQPIISIDLPRNFFVVLRGNGITQPKILRSARDFAIG